MFSGHKIRLLLLITLVLALLSSFISPPKTSADILFNRSVTISTGIPSAVATHSFKFDIPTTSNIGSITFQYCSNTPDFFEACTAPAGLDVSSAVLGTQIGNTGFTVDAADTTASEIVLTRAVSPGAMTANTYVFDNITNPSTAGVATFVRISTHNTTDGSGPWEDNGGVAFAVQNIFNIGAYVPPFLAICVAITVAPDCSSMSGDSIDLGILSSKRVSFGQSQFATATNDPAGYIIYALGNTMTSGNNIIPNIPNPAPSFPGTGQFGFNLRANLIPAVGQDPVGLGTATPAPNYDIPNQFVYNPGDSIASSTTTTNYNRMTASYVVNIPAGQPPGVYATTITYVATVQF